MTTFGISVAGALALAAALLLVLVGWRLSSRSGPCPSWLSPLVEIDNPLFRSNRAAVIVERLAPRTGMRVLDAGCGPGRLTLPLARRVGPAGLVIAVDAQEGMLRKLEANLLAAGLANVTTRKMHLGTGVQDLRDFDRAVLSAVLGEIPDRRAVLVELYDALKPGGLLAISELIADPHFQGLAAVRALAGSVGLREVTLVGGRLAYTIILERPAAT